MRRGNGFTQQIGDDWWLTFAGARNALVAEVYTDNNSNYTATINYYIYDYYDWNIDGEEELANLHKYGMAKSFRTIGLYSFNISWEKGSRYPSVVNASFPLDKTEFNGINDHSSLKNSFEQGKECYNTINEVGRSIRSKYT